MPGEKARPKWAQERDRQWEKIKQRAREEAEKALRAESKRATEEKKIPGDDSVTVPKKEAAPSDSESFPQEEYDRAVKEAHRSHQSLQERLAKMEPVKPYEEPIAASVQNQWADMRFAPLHGKDPEPSPSEPAFDPFESEPTTFTWTPIDGDKQVHALYHLKPEVKRTIPRHSQSISRSIKHGILALSAFVGSLISGPAPIKESQYVSPESAKIEGSRIAGISAKTLEAPHVKNEPTINRQVQNLAVKSGIPTDPEEPRIQFRLRVDNKGPEVAGYLLRDLVRELGGSIDAQLKSVSLPRIYLLKGKHLQAITGSKNAKITARTIPDGTELQLDRFYSDPQVRDSLLKRTEKLRLDQHDKEIVSKAISRLYELSAKIG